MDGHLLGVSEFIDLPKPKPPRPIRKIPESLNEHPMVPITKEPEYTGPPIEVEGSTEYLRIILPSSEHPNYKEVLRLMRGMEFFTRPGSPPLVVVRDTSKVLDFLATHQEDFELDYEATFTENCKADLYDQEGGTENLCLRIRAFH